MGFKFGQLGTEALALNFFAIVHVVVKMIPKEKKGRRNLGDEMWLQSELLYKLGFLQGLKLKKKCM